MKYIFTLTTFLIISLVGQTQQYNYDLAKEYLNKIGSDKYLENRLIQLKEFYNNQHLQEVFEDYNLDVKNEADKTEYINRINSRLDLFINDVKGELLVKYGQYDSLQLHNFIKLVEINPKIELAGIATDYFKNLEIVMNNLQSDLLNIFQLTVENVQANHRPLKLIFKIDNDTLFDYENLEVEIFLMTSNSEHEKVDILDNKSFEIITPEYFDYDEIEYLIVSYDSHDYSFFKHVEIPGLSQEGNDAMNRNLDKYCFEELLYWTIHIENNTQEFNTDVIKNMGVEYSNKRISITTCNRSSAELK